MRPECSRGQWPEFVFPTLVVLKVWSHSIIYQPRKCLVKVSLEENINGCHNKVNYVLPALLFPSFPPCQCKQTQLDCFGGCTQQLARSPGEHRTSPAPSWCPFWKHDLCSSLNAMAVISDCSSLHCPCLTQPRSIIPAEATGIFLHRSHWRSACILHGHIAHTFQNPAFIKKKKKIIKQLQANEVHTEY